MVNIIIKIPASCNTNYEIWYWYAETLIRFLHKHLQNIARSGWLVGNLYIIIFLLGNHENHDTYKNYSRVEGANRQI